MNLDKLHSNQNLSSRMVLQSQILFVSSEEYFSEWERQLCLPCSLSQTAWRLTSCNTSILLANLDNPS